MQELVGTKYSGQRWVEDVRIGPNFLLIASGTMLRLNAQATHPSKTTPCHALIIRFNYTESTETLINIENDAAVVCRIAC